ncbi:MAG: archease [Candidatus Woesearchaeota archaeon]
MTKPFELLDHTADLKIVANGKSMEEAFSNAAKGMYSYMADIKKIKPKVQKKIAVKANKLTTLLYEFLEELLVLTDTDNLLFSEMENMKIEKKKDIIHLTCIAKGDDFRNYETHGDVKSITYSEMEIDETKNRVQFVVDI